MLLPISLSKAAVFYAGRAASCCCKGWWRVWDWRC